jgi:trehalose 6-phosphate synthase
VDVDAVAHQAEEAAKNDEQVKRLVQSMPGRKLLLGVDRLDYSKALVERFASYQALWKTLFADNPLRSIAHGLAR